MTSVVRPLVVTAFLFAYFILSLDVISVFIPANFYGQNWGTHWEHGEYTKEPPVAYRLLIPNVAYAVRTLVPASLKESIKNDLIVMRSSPSYAEWVGIMGTTPPPLSNDRIFGTTMYFLVIYCSLLAFIGMLYALARELFPDSLAYALLAPVVALLTIVPITRLYAYYYDFSSMFFTCACLYLLCKRRWKSYILCLLIGVYNEETALFVTVFYFMYFYTSLPRRNYIRLGVLQVVLGIGLEAIIRYVTVHDVFSYAMNGSTVWLDGKAGQLWWFESIKFLMAHDLTDLLHMMLLAVLLSYHWMEKPEFLRKCGWMVVANTLVFIVICKPGEYRDLYASLPILVLMATHSLVRLSGADMFHLFRPNPKSTKLPEGITES